jgi:hypothetical protein
MTFNPYILLAAIVFVVVTSFASYRVGVKLERGEWAERESKINAEAAAEIAASAKDAAAQVQAGALAIAGVSAYYQGKLKEKDRAKDRAVADALVDGLYVSAECPDRGVGMPNAPAGGRGDTATARVRLSDEASVFLISEATRADKIVAQLTSCQQQLNIDRQTVNAKN